MTNFIKIIFFFILLLNCVVFYGQSVYSKHINLAELDYIDSNYKSALENYEKAFISRKNIFGKDLYNAALTAVKIKNYEKCNLYLDSLCSKGFNILKLNNNLFSKFLKTSYFKYLKKKNSANRNFDSIKFNNNLYLNNILQDDQYFRIKTLQDIWISNILK